MAGKTIEPSDVNYYDELPAKRPVAQARKSLNFRFIFTEIDKPFFVLIMLLLMFGIYRQSTAKVRRLERDMRHSILRELPGFLNALVLLLNAGMVFESAFLRVVENYAQYKGSRKDYFYDQMREVCVSMKEANASAVSGIAAFAGRCGVREMMRIASIITDSAGKGAALAEKLGRESRMLWFMRKKRSEEKGRIAETKMTLPLMILLMVLILIAVAPAMMDM